MKRFFPTACLAVVISLLLSVIWPSQSNAAAPVFSSLGQLRAAGMGAPGALDLDAAGNLYVADMQTGHVFRFDTYGRFKAKFELHASGNGLAVTPDGSVLYVARANSVAVVNAATGDLLGTLAGSVASGDEFGIPKDIELDADGRVYVADSLAAKVKIYSKTGSYLASVGAYGANAGQFYKVGGMVIDNQGRLIVADASYNNAKVHVFTLNPVTLVASTPAAYPLTTTTTFGSPALTGPRGITFDNQGRGYFLDFMTSQIRVVSISNTAVAAQGAYTKAGSGQGQLALVADVVYDEVNRRLFVSCGDSRVEILGIDGGTSPVYVNHKPSLPVQQSPVGGSEVTTDSPLLQYAAASDQDGDPVSYRVTVRQGAAELFSTQTDATTVTVPAGLLAENAACSWTVEAFDTEGAGSGSLTATFVVNAVNESPSTPVLVAPLHGESLAGAGVLAWQAASDPDPNDTLLGYRVEVAADAAFAAPVLSAQVGGLEIGLDAFAAYADLVDGGAYFWRAVAVDSDNMVSAPGTAGSFVYDTALLKVTANIADARVSLAGNHAFAGRIVGTAPLEVRDLAAGALSVVVERDGFEPYVAQVGFAGAENVAIHATLAPALQPAALQLVGNGINGRSGLAVSAAAAPFLVDFDNDGQLDLLVGDASGQISLFPAMQLTSRGQLVFGSPQGIGLPVLPGAVPFVADWNNDGRKDLLVGLADGAVKLFLNSGEEAAPAFAAGQDLAVVGGVVNAGGQAAPAVLDLNGDGAKDLVVGNAAGEIMAFLNQGSDAAPQLALAGLLAQVAGAAVPAPVDLDADGQRDLLVTAGGQAVPFRNDLAVSGTFVAGAPLAGGGINAVFPLDIDGQKGKDLLVGQVDGKLAYWKGNGSVLTASGLAGLLEKLDEVAALVAEAAPELLGQVAKVRSQIESQSLGAAAKSAQTLAGQLAAGAARTAVEELALMCNPMLSSLNTSSKK